MQTGVLWITAVNCKLQIYEVYCGVLKGYENAPKSTTSNIVSTSYLNNNRMEDVSRSVAANAKVLAAEIRARSLPPLDDEAFPVSFPLLSPEGSRAWFELISAALKSSKCPEGSVTTILDFIVE